ncbi:multiple resistance and pH regulation protein F [Thermoanaerobacter wiegelii Rt8.B1]|uniref:Multiple resistance and pH regulation protein F n=1 Tax=Thermoanaerobacter wiegelii Rt8.B1 TaxID=697303 RepID=G2MUM6_9THEO|nr:monovalent cation/H+ antiporter complex subunit F [Thermoanaerobacter wiegelii]AEM77549.1 multiple resistance and pH regulation protein F [Thermoanaerobacter wiegelii Rt8.B1]
MIINVILGLVIFGLLLSFIRLVRSSSIESKVVAIDIMTTISSGLIVIFAFISDNGLFLDVALVYGIYWGCSNSSLFRRRNLVCSILDTFSCLLELFF